MRAHETIAAAARASIKFNYYARRPQGANRMRYSGSSSSSSFLSLAPKLSTRSRAKCPIVNSPCGWISKKYVVYNDIILRVRARIRVFGSSFRYNIVYVGEGQKVVYYLIYSPRERGYIIGAVFTISLSNKKKTFYFNISLHISVLQIFVNKIK